MSSQIRSFFSIPCLLLSLFTAAAAVNAHAYGDLQRALKQAVRFGKLDQIRQLLDQGANPCEPDSRGISAIENSVISALVASFNILLPRALDLGCDLHSVNASGQNLVSKAVLSNSPAIVKRILELGVSPNIQDMYGNYPIHLLGGTMPINTLDLLLRYGANIDSRNAKGATALHVAISLNPKLATALMKRGADVNAIATQDPIYPMTANALQITKWTPLFIAARDNNSDMVYQLLQNGAMANFSANDISGMTFTQNFANTPNGRNIIRLLNQAPQWKLEKLL
jgi:ankyrin repeat protein